MHLESTERTISRSRRTNIALTAVLIAALVVPMPEPAGAEVTGLVDCRFSRAQVFDVQWGVGGGVLNVSGMTRPFASNEPRTGQLRVDEIADDDTFGFFENGDEVGFRQYDASGAVKNTLHLRGVFRATGEDFIFYNGNGSWGTLITSGEGFSYGDSASLTVTAENVDLATAVGYQSCSATPLAVGQTRADIGAGGEDGGDGEDDGDGEPSPPAPPAPTPVPNPGGGLPVSAPEGPEASRDGSPVEIATSSPVDGVAEFVVGPVGLRIDMAAGGAGTVDDDGATLRVSRDGVADVAGDGMRPGGIVEAWVVLPDGASRRVALLPVAADGTFDGALPFTGELDAQGPLPIGDRTIQLFGTDADGRLTVINVAVRIEQPGPLRPEPERAPGAPPTLAPGQTLATVAGIPTTVTVTPLPDARSARIEGDGWLIDLDVPDGTVRDEAGAPLIEIVNGTDSNVRGTGFMPGTRAYVWLMSDPMFLGEVTVGPDGTFDGAVPVDGVAPGQHTLQLSGVGTDGYVRAANLGVILTGGVVPARVPTGGGPMPLVPFEAMLVVLLAGVLAVLAERERDTAAVVAEAARRGRVRRAVGAHLAPFDALEERLERLRSRHR